MGRGIYVELNKIWDQTSNYLVSFLLATLSFYIAMREARVISRGIPLIVGVTLLILITVWLYTRYKAATFKELKIWEEYLKESYVTKRLDNSPWFIATGLSILFGGLLLTVGWIHWYIFVWVIYLIFDFLGNEKIQRELKPVVYAQKADEKDLCTIEVLDAIDEYYLKNPMLMRSYIMNLISILICILAFINWLFIKSYTVEVGIYAAVLFSIIVSESVIGIWRKKYFDKLNIIETRLQGKNRLL